MKFGRVRKTRKSSLRVFATLGLLALVLVLGACHVSAAGNTVLARVDGEAITQHALMAHMPKDQFTTTEEDLKAVKLDRLIDEAVLGHFLRKEHLTVAEQTIDAEIAYERIYPPSAGCMCCRFKSLQQYMDLNGYTMDELRTEIRNNEGYNQYLRAQWEKAYPTRAARLAYAHQQKARIVKSYIKLSHIFFNTFQQAAYANDPQTVEKAKQAQANAAWKRVQQGESFTAVAKAVSDDMMSRESGGALGCIRRDVFGDDISKTLARLPAGVYSRPVESIWGFHIFKWAPMNDGDVVEVLKREYMEHLDKTFFATLERKAHIQRAQPESGQD